MWEECQEAIARVQVGDLGYRSRKDEFERYLGRPKYRILQTFMMNCTWEGVNLGRSQSCL